jgi:hypothetical protein
LYQPFESAVRLGVAETTGAVASILRVTESEDDPPALCAVQEDATDVVSLENVWVPHPESTTTAESGSVTVQATWTAERYQPLFPSVPVTTFVMTGGVESLEPMFRVVEPLDVPCRLSPTYVALSTRGLVLPEGVYVTWQEPPLNVQLFALN